jgi:hypothetical protein
MSERGAAAPDGQMSSGSSHHHAFSRMEMIAAFALLAVSSVAVYTLLWIADFGFDMSQSPLALITQPGTVDTLTNFGEVTVGILGVSLTVVTIIVELASNRYTPRITELFLRDPVNWGAMSFFVVSAVVILWIDMSLFGATSPETMATAAIGLMTLTLLALLPYFAYVFDFLLPTRVVHRIERAATGAIRRVTRQGASEVPAARAEVRTAVEQLGDVALNSVDKKDKAIAFASLAALAELGVVELEEKAGLPEEWFDTRTMANDDPDFVALHPQMVRALAVRRTWMLMKILRQFQVVFGEALNQMRDVDHLIAIHTRRLAARAADHHDPVAQELCLHFLNTYMRASINARDVRTAYNLFNEYRVLAEYLLRAGHHEDVVAIANRCKFYGQLGFQVQIPFIAETAAYDMGMLLEHAHEAQAACHDAVLDVFLELDREAKVDAQETSLRGVRKAQVKLATYYMTCGADDFARRIHADMAHEPLDRLRSICTELESVVDAEYWEVSDRGINFDYLPPDRRSRLAEFFSWFEHWEPV